MLVKKYRPDLESIMIKKLANQLSKEIDKHILNKFRYAYKKDWK